MSKLSLALTLAALVGTAELRAQPANASVPFPKASLNVKTQLNMAGTKVKLLRKRFYLFAGITDKEREPLSINRDLISRIRAATVQSRDCFYCAQGASAAYMAWLHLKDCETPYCREITVDDVQNVPEFTEAYRLALVKYKNKPDLARKWLTPFLPAGRRDGYYLEQKQAVTKTLGGVAPIATVMTDPSQGQANFIDIQLTNPQKESEKSKDPTQPFLFSTVLPLEVAGKFYTWICTVKLKPGVNSITLPIATNNICEVIVRDIPKCVGGACKQ